MAIQKVKDSMRTTTVLDAAKVTTGTMDAARIGSGTFADARISQASVVQHSPSVDLSPVKNDISLLALQTAMNGNMTAYGLKNSWIEQFENSTYIANLSTVARNSSEYMSAISIGLGAFTSDSDTAFLLHSDTSNGSTTFTDSSSHGRTLTAQGTSPVHSTAKQKIGASSILLNGSNGLYSTINASLTFAGDWTMEYWIWTPNSGGGSRVVGLATSNSNFQQYTRHKSQSGSYGIGQVIHSSEPNNAGVAWDDDGHNVPGGVERSAISDWVHIAFVRQTKTIRAYFNGVQRVDWTKPTLYTSPTSGLLGIGYCTNCGPGEFVQSGSYLDEIRISGVCRYPDGTTFTPNEVSVINATGSFTSTVIIPQDTTNKSSVGLVILYKDNGSADCALNVDVVAQVRANTGQAYDSGSNTLALVPAGTLSDSLKIAIAPAIAVTAGQALSYKISFANQTVGVKEARIHGVAMTY